jgi:hypothetical protein
MATGYTVTVTKNASSILHGLVVVAILATLLLALVVVAAVVYQSIVFQRESDKRWLGS